MQLADLSLTLAVIKAHLRVEHAVEDDLIALYAQAALANALKYVDKPAGHVFTAAEKSLMKPAVLLWVADMYNHRANTTHLQTYNSNAAEALLWKVRNFRDSAEVAA